MGVVIRDFSEVVNLMGVRQGIGLMSPKQTEAQTYIFITRQAIELGFSSNKVEGGC